ncbi:MAG: TonB-dependent receptor [Bacteroidetes bacterium]|nr:TonB-dependent receptor [Bacteroidota bacterium]
MKKLVLLVLITVTGVLFAGAQQTISGKVTDDKSGNPMPGVSISLKNGKAIGTTDAQGNFALNVPSNTASVVFSFIGYNDVEQKTGQGMMTIKMSSGKNQSLTEVVVTGYGNRSKRSYTGSAGTVAIDEIHTQPIASFDQLLQGQMTGVSVKTGTGQPGSSADVLIRGRASLSGGTNPLYIVDGVEINAADFATMNQGDFETINVLKDAAAASIYGSRAARGVVVITTKRGRAGKTKFNYDFQYGQSDWTRSKLKLMNSAEKLGYELEHGNPNGWTPQDVDSLSKINTDWESVFFHKGITQSHQLSASGGNERTKFYTSLGYFDQTGVVRTTGLKRYTGRINIESGTDRLKYGINATLGYSKLQNTRENDQYIGSPLNAILWSLPYITPYDKNGEFTIDNTANAQPNPLRELLLNTSSTDQLKAVGNIFLEYKIPFVKDLTAKTSWGADYTQNEIQAYVDPSTYASTQVVGSTGSFAHAFNRTTRIIGTTSLNFKRSFGEHDFSITAYNEYIPTKARSFGFTGYGLILPFQNEGGITAGTADNGFIPTVGGNSPANRALLSYFAEADYGYLNRYFIHAGFRRDGSSRFGINKRWANFFNVAGAWIISDENFFASLKNKINLFKVKLSYGTAGNDEANLGDFPSRPLFGKVNYAGNPGLSLNSPGNPNLQWEQKASFNFGIEFGILKNRVSGSVEFYNDKTTNLFYSLPVSQTTGFTTQISNAGSLRNRGIELQLKIVPVKTKQFSWTIDGNFTYNKNTVLSLPNGTDTVNFGSTTLKIGMPANTFYLVKYAGVDPATGNPLYYTKDGKGTTQVYDPGDRVFFGTADAPYYGGITNTFNYKGIELEVFWIYSFGNEIYNNDRLNVENPAYLVSGLSKDLLREWRNPGDITNIPSANSDYQLGNTNYFLENGGFWRLRNIRLSYDIPKSFLGKSTINSLRVFVQGQNLYTYTKYRGYDPELPPAEQSVHQGAVYPPLKTITFGINIGL